MIKNRSKIINKSFVLIFIVLSLFLTAQPQNKGKGNRNPMDYLLERLGVPEAKKVIILRKQVGEKKRENSFLLRTNIRSLYKAPAGAYDTKQYPSSTGASKGLWQHRCVKENLA